MILVVDNNPDCIAKPVVKQFSEMTKCSVRYFPQACNSGPAGAFHIAIKFLLDQEEGIRWMMCRGDDNTLDKPDIVHSIVKIIERVSDSCVGGVGLFGKKYRPLTLTQDTSIFNGLKHADFIPGGGAPTYNLHLLKKHNINFAPNLFFGFEELHLGLQLKNKKIPLLVENVVSGDYLSAPPRHSYWRTYFNYRNRLIVSREFVGSRRAYKVFIYLLFRITRQVIGLNSVGNIKSALLGIWDGLTQPTSPPRKKYIPK